MVIFIYHFIIYFGILGEKHSHIVYAYHSLWFVSSYEFIQLIAKIFLPRKIHIQIKLEQ